MTGLPKKIKKVYRRT